MLPASPPLAPRGDTVLLPAALVRAEGRRRDKDHPATLQLWEPAGKEIQAANAEKGWRR